MGTKKDVRIKVSVDRETVKARIDRSKGAASAAPNSALHKADPVLAAAGTDLVTAGTDLQTAEDDVQKAEMKLAIARSKRLEKIASYDRAHKVYVSHVEMRAKSPGDAKDAGLEVLELASHGIAAPAGLTARADHGKKEIRILVERVPGIDSYLVEISAGAVGAEPRTWKRLPGVGVRRVLKGVSPGDYLVRAVAMRASEEGEPTAPVAVTVY